MFSFPKFLKLKFHSASINSTELSHLNRIQLVLRKYTQIKNLCLCWCFPTPHFLEGSPRARI